MCTASPWRPLRRFASLTNDQWIEWGERTNGRTLELDAYSVRRASDALCPEGLVKLGVETDVLCAHGLLSECDHRLDGPRCALLEGAAMYALVEMNRLLSGDDVLEGATSLSGGLFLVCGCHG